MDIQDYAKKTALFGKTPPFSDITQAIAQVMIAYFPQRTHQSLALTNKEWYAQVRGRLFLFYPLKGQLDRYLIQTTLTHSDLPLLQKQTGIEPTIPPGKQSLEDFTLGRGAFGELKLALTHKGGRYIGIKVTRGKGVERELNIQKALSGIPGLLPLLDSVQEGESLYQVMPLGQLDARKLKARLDTLTDPLFKGEVCSHIAKGLLEALAAMHKQGYYHLDVKPDNLIINAKGEPLLIDFGCTVHTSTSSLLFEEIGGDVRYHAPELKTLTPLKAYEAAPLDSWAAGITLLELAAPSFDFTQESSETLIGGALLDKERFFSYLAQEGLPKLASPEEGSYWGLMKSLLNPDPDKRLTPSQTLSHPALKKASPDTLAFLTDLASNPQTDKRPTQAAPPKAQPTKIPKSNFPKGLGYSSGSMRSSQNKPPPKDPKEINLFSPQTPPKHPSTYIERKELQEELCKRLTQQKEGLIAAYGIGGIGKTQLMTRLFYNEVIASHFGRRLWFRNADTSLDLQYLTLAQEWGLVDQTATYEQAIARVHRKLVKEAEGGKAWLIVFDNAGEYTSLKKYLPPKGGWAVATTRTPGWPETFPITALTQEEGVALTKKLLQKEDNHVLLCNRLGNLPLALVQACAYIRNQSLSIDAYLNLLKTKPNALLSNEQLLGKNLSNNMLDVWGPTFALLEEKHPESLQLLNLIAYLSPELSPPLLNELTANNEALPPLIAYNLLESQGESHNIHRLVQEVLRLKHSPEECRIFLEQGMKALITAFGENPFHYSRRKINRQLTPSGEIILTYLNKTNPQKEESLLKLERKLAFRVGTAFNNLDGYRKAIEFHQKQLKIAEEIEDRDGQGRASNSLGNAYQSLGEYRKAIEFHEKHLKLAEEIEDRAGQGTAFGNLGNAYQSLGEYRKAIEFHEKHLKIAEEVEDKDGQGKAFSGLGNAYQSLGKYRKAIKFHEKLLKIAKELEDRAGQGAAFGSLGNAYKSLGEYRKAIEFHQKQLKIAEEIEDRAGQGKAFGNLGRSYNSLGEYEQAVELHKKQLKIAEEIEDKDGQETVLGGLGNAYYSLGKYRKAIEFYESLLKTAEELEDRAGQGKAFGNLGVAYNSLGEYQKAIEFHQKQLKIAKEIEDKDGQGKAFSGLGAAYQSLGKHEQVIELHEKCLKLEEEMGDRAGQGATFGNLGIAYHDLGEYRKAIAFHEKCLKIAEELEDRAGQGAAFGNLGIAYNSLGEYQKAIEFHQKALATAEALKDRARQGRAFGNLGIAYHDLGEYRKAIEFHQKCLKIAEEIEDKAGKEAAFGNLGIAYQSLGEYKQAIEFHQKRLKIAEELEDRARQGRAFGNLGIAYQSLGETRKAIEYHKKSLAIAEALEDKAGKEAAFCNLGNAYYSLGKVEEAIAYTEKALAIFEKTYGREHPHTKQAEKSLALLRQSLPKSPQQDIQKQVEAFAKACINGDKSLAESISHQFPLAKDLCDKEGNPLICWLAQHTMTSVITRVLELGWNPNLPNKGGVYPLHYAAMKSLKLTRVLLPHANPFVQTAKGSTPAMVAKSKGNMETLALLIPPAGLSFEDAKSFEDSYVKYKADLLAEQAPSFESLLEAFTLALHFKDWDLAKEVAGRHNLHTLLERVIKQHPAAKERLLKGIEPFTKACLGGDEALALDAIKVFTFEKDLYDKGGHSLVSWVAQKEMSQTMEAILKLGWSPNLPNKNGVYPLHYAAMKSVPLTHLLLQAKANPFVTTAKGSTPAMVARSKGNAETLQAILPKIEGLAFGSGGAFEECYLAYKTSLLEASFKVDHLPDLFELILHLGDVELAKALSHKAPTKMLLEELIQKYPFAKEALAIRYTHLFEG